MKPSRALGASVPPHLSPAPFAPDAASPAVLAAGCCGAHIQAHIEGLGQKLFPHVVRIRASKAPGNLFGHTALGQVRPEVLPLPGGQEFLLPLWLTGPGCPQRLCRADTIRVAPRRVAGGLAAHGAGAPPQHRRLRPQHGSA